MSWLKDLEESLLIGSTLVEGSTLTEAEAKQVLAGKTVQGHPISEIRELLNYRSSVQWLVRQLEKAPFLSLDLLFEFHRGLFQGFPGEHGRWKSSRNYTYLSDGTRHDYLQPAQVQTEMLAWITRYNTAPAAGHLETAATLYYEFQEIHPFDDGNGRIGRILIAFWLHRHSRKSWSFRLKDKVAHLKSLEAANRGDLRPLIRFFKERLRK